MDHEHELLLHRHLLTMRYGRMIERAAHSLNDWINGVHAAGLVLSGYWLDRANETLARLEAMPDA